MSFYDELGDHIDLFDKYIHLTILFGNQFPFLIDLKPLHPFLSGQWFRPTRRTLPEVHPFCFNLSLFVIHIDDKILQKSKVLLDDSSEFFYCGVWVYLVFGDLIVRRELVVNAVLKRQQILWWVIDSWSVPQHKRHLKLLLPPPLLPRHHNRINHRQPSIPLTLTIPITHHTSLRQ